MYFEMVNDCIISNNTIYTLSSGNLVHGIYFYYSHRNIIKDNEISGFKNGLNMGIGSNNKIISTNLLFYNNIGLVLYSCNTTMASFCG